MIYPLTIDSRTFVKSAKLSIFVFATLIRIDVADLYADGQGGQLRENVLKMEMISIPFGTFQYGMVADLEKSGLREEAVETLTERLKNAEKPKTVSIDRNLEVSTCEVTFKELILAHAINRTKLLIEVPVNPNLPVVRVSPVEVIKFCNILSRLEGFDEVYEISELPGRFWKVNFNANGYRLPSVNEWEYLAKAGTEGQLFWFGNDVGDNDFPECNFQDRSALSQLRIAKSDPAWSTWSAYLDDGFPELAEPKHFPPNQFGLFEILGNAAEMCHLEENDIDGEAENNSERYFPVAVRGGSFWQPVEHCVCLGSSSSDVTVNMEYDLGFRVVRTLSKKDGP